MSWFLLNRNLTLLEPYDWKLSCTVLRGERSSNAPDLPGKKANHPEKANTAEGLREIVRRERQIEFYLENQRFWDLRRWKDAGILGEKVWGMNIEGDTDETFFVPTELQNIRTFKQAQYLMPIPMTETNKVPHIVQNPGY